MWNEFRDWLKQPFRVDMSATEWFLFIGLLIVIVAAWNFVLFHLTDALNEA